jgi:hypothetical protein
LPLTLGYEKVLFHSEHPLELLDKEDRAMKYNTSRVDQVSPAWCTSIQIAVTPRYEYLLFVAVLMFINELCYALL